MPLAAGLGDGSRVPKFPAKAAEPWRFSRRDGCKCRFSSGMEAGGCYLENAACAFCLVAFADNSLAVQSRFNQ